MLFLIYINDLNMAISHSLIHHFANDTRVLYSNKSLKKINKHINHDLSLTVQWLRANRISLNTGKTEILLLRPQGKQIKKHLNFRLSGQQISIVEQTKYLSLYLDEHLTWNFQLSQIKSRLSRSCGLLAKLRYFVNSYLLRTVYYSVFDSVMKYGLQIWGQHNGVARKKTEKIQEKAVKIIDF